MANQYGNDLQPIKCDVCETEQARRFFSYNDRNQGAKSGYRTTCKKCSRNAKAIEKRNRDWKYKPALHMLNNSKQRAKKAGIEHTITVNDIVIPDYCPVLNIKLDTGDRRRHGNAPSIDRIDNTKGYTKENIMVVSNRANMLKNDASLDELIMIGNFYRNLKEKQNEHLLSTSRPQTMRSMAHQQAYHKDGS
jgi:hypothetical protein